MVRSSKTGTKSNDDRPGGSRSMLPVVVMAAIAAATVAAYWPVAAHGFVSFDDNVYVSQNPDVLGGLSWQGVKWAFTAFHGCNWHPLTWLSHMLDISLFGPRPAGHHLVNLAWHLLNTGLLFWFLIYTTHRLWPAAFVAAIFALHPLHVESVAWVAERKDVLSTFFWLATMLAWAWYARKPSVLRYASVMVLFALGLMAKPMLVTLPLVLLLLDFWPLDRFDRRRVLVEKLPLVAMAAASALMTVLAQRQALASIVDVDLITRVANAAVSYWRYIAAMVWPAGLAVHYPHPRKPLYIEAAVVMLLMAAVTVVVWRMRQRKYLLTGWAWYLLTLVPVIGIIQVGNQSHADRYTYIPLLGIFVIIAWGAADLISWRPQFRLPLAVLGLAALAAAAPLTRHTVGYWKNDLTLYSRAIEVSPKDAMMRAALAGALVSDGQNARAEVLVKETIAMDDRQAGALSLLGVILIEQGKLDEAEVVCKKAIALDPSLALTHYAMSNLYTKRGESQKAIDELLEAVKYQPSYSSYGNLGNAYLGLKDYRRAEESYRKAIFMEPQKTDAHYNLAVVLVRMDRKAEAAVEIWKVLAIAPDDKDALILLSTITKP
jgi:Flp pilus assembly protein TadD